MPRRSISAIAPDGVGASAVRLGASFSCIVHCNEAQSWPAETENRSAPPAPYLARLLLI
jgi:hypothetical protein